jgi:predicted RNase H-like HicB family nuclease
MRVLHVQVERDNKWYVAQGLEEPGVITQGRTLDEIVANVREVMELMFGARQVQIELILPAIVPGARDPKLRGPSAASTKRRSRDARVDRATESVG